VRQTVLITLRCVAKSGTTSCLLI